MTLFTGAERPGGVLAELVDQGRLAGEILDTLLNQLTAAGVEIVAGNPPAELRPAPLREACVPAEAGPAWLPDLERAADPISLEIQGRPGFFQAVNESSRSMPVVNALAAGKASAESAHRYLIGRPLSYNREFYSSSGALKRFDPTDSREPAPRKELTGEIARAGEAARQQARRCLSCGRPVEANYTCWSCLPCEIECPTGALTIHLPYQIR